MLKSFTIISRNKIDVDEYLAWNISVIECKGILHTERNYKGSALGQWELATNLLAFWEHRISLSRRWHCDQVSIIHCALRHQ